MAAMWHANARPVEKSQTLLLNEQQRLQVAAGREVFKFGFGRSPFPPLPATVAALAAHAADKDYTPVQGLPELRERVAAFRHRRLRQAQRRLAHGIGHRRRQPEVNGRPV
jgi:aspartate/methionine/tyrosine aminotransferase